MSEEAPEGQGYCWPSLGEPCGKCHRCAKDPEPIHRPRAEWPDIPKAKS